MKNTIDIIAAILIYSPFVIAGLTVIAVIWLARNRDALTRGRQTPAPTYKVSDHCYHGLTRKDWT